MVRFNHTSRFRIEALPGDLGSSATMRREGTRSGPRFVTLSSSSASPPTDHEVQAHRPLAVRLGPSQDVALPFRTN